MKQLFTEQLHTEMSTWEDIQVPEFQYRVTRVVNSSTPNVYDYLSKEQLDTYCEDDEWKVTVS
jgi:hypothetical protein